MNTDYDAIIIGGRVAGAVLAVRLAQLGQRVLVLEKAEFPSDTLSTSFFRAPSLQAFDEIGVLDKITAMAPPMRMLWNYIDGHILADPVDGTEERYNFFLCERRVTLDWILYKRMKRELNIEVRLGAKLKGLLWHGGRVSGVRWNEQAGEGEASAKVVVGADGFYSTLAQIVQPAYESYIPAQRCTYYAYFQDLDSFDAPTAEHHFVGNTLTYVFPTDGNLTMVAVSMPIGDFARFKAFPLKNLMAHLESLPLLVPRLNDAKLASPIYGSGNIPSYQRMPYGAGWVLVGDSQQVMDPWSGMGMDHATTHAGFLADALHRWLNGSASWESAMADYRSRARNFSEKAYRRTTTFAADLRPMTHAALMKRGLMMAAPKVYAL